MKVMIAMVVGLITFSFAGVAAAGTRCASSEPRDSGSSFNNVTIAMMQSPNFALSIIQKMH